MRATVFANLDSPARIDTGIRWWDWTMGTPWQILTATGLTLAMLAAGIIMFDRTE